jgi:hypothetical protein
MEVMSESSDDLLAELLRDMHTLIESRKPDMSPADIKNAMEWVASVASTCGAATQHCDQMQYSDTEARAFMTSILRAMVECTRVGITEANECHSNASVH